MNKELLKLMLRNGCSDEIEHLVKRDSIDSGIKGEIMNELNE